jgi:large subunit ribosomal protein L21
VYAVIRTGGKQYKVKAGDVLDVERLAGDDGASVELVPLLVVDDDGNVTSAADELRRALVTATVVEQRRGRKLRVFTYKNKTGQQRHQGHRQSLTRLKVERIDLPGAGQPKARATASGPEETES